MNNTIALIQFCDKYFNSFHGKCFQKTGFFLIYSAIFEDLKKYLLIRRFSI